MIEESLHIITKWINHEQSLLSKYLSSNHKKKLYKLFFHQKGKLSYTGAYILMS